jgi:hypothetical protein
MTMMIDPGAFDTAVHGSLLAALGGLILVAIWFIVKAVVGHLLVAAGLREVKRRRWGRAKKEHDND